MLLLLHLGVVILAPLAFATRPNPAEAPSPAVLPLVRLAQPYMDAAYLNHGYAFFAPNPPAASALLRYRVEFDDDRPPIEGVLPDLESHWPRLYYHRHFMLSEQLSARFVPATPPPGRGPHVQQWKAQRAEYEKLLNSFRQHLLNEYDGDRVHLSFYDHRPPGVDEFRRGVPLNSPDLYRPRPDRPPGFDAGDPMRLPTLGPDFPLGRDSLGPDFPLGPPGEPNSPQLPWMEPPR